MLCAELGGFLSCVAGAGAEGIAFEAAGNKACGAEQSEHVFALRNLGDGCGQVAIFPVVPGEVSPDEGHQGVQVKAEQRTYRLALRARKFEDHNNSLRLEHAAKLAKSGRYVFKIPYAESDGCRLECRVGKRQRQAVPLD